MAPVGGVDLGATNLRAAVADGAGEPAAIERTATPTGDGTAVARAAAEALEAAAERAGYSMAGLDAVGVGSIGPLDRAAGTVVRPPNLPGVDRIPLQDVLIALLGHPRVYVENDAVAGLVGERAAAEGPAANLVYLTLSTGIGAGIAVDGHVLRGGRATRPRWATSWSSPGAGAAAAEAPATGRPTARRRDPRARPRPRRGRRRQLAAHRERGAAGPDVFAAVGDDPLADRVVETVQRYNAIGVADLVHAYAPDRIAVGGSVALENPELMIEPLAAAVDEHTMLAVPTIGPAVHGDDAVLRGALTLAAQGGLER
ncbi:MAG: ROK family protein [Halobacteriales archaeon]|nr:ROK family protein [Halobacteriales archaeon]